MPTNPKWLEHTERAAWDTVKTLRHKLEEEQKRVARLSPVGGSWRRMVDMLDAAKARHRISAEHYADILEELCTRLDDLSRREQELTERLSVEDTARRQQVVEVIAAAPSRRDAAGEPDGDIDWYRERVAELVSELSGGTGSTKRPGIERLIGRAERRLEELEDARSSDAFELAAEIGALAMTIAKRRQRSSPPSGDR